MSQRDQRLQQSLMCGNRQYTASYCLPLTSQECLERQKPSPTAPVHCEEVWLKIVRRHVKLSPSVPAARWQNQSGKKTAFTLSATRRR
mmetsp:Transcript_54775/g.102628  ORF Transcript_54775/g.102628 Transcript_54775/m.102628 type:complete len:88 (-) Transcript_54775:169-432(-)